MKRARVLVLGIAVTAAVGAALLAKNLLAPPPAKVVTKTDFDTVKVLVARKPIALGDSVSAAVMRWQDWPREAAQGDFIVQGKTPSAIKELSGSIARTQFSSGEPLKIDRLIKSSDGGVMAAILPSGMRAISTPIREDTAAGGFILPNDRVDVIVTRQIGTMQSQHTSDTVLKNVRVLAIGQNIETKDGKKVAAGKTATLELSPRQAELIALARTMGELSLSLRSLADIGKDSSKEVSSNPFGRPASQSIKILKYGFSSSASSVN